MADPGGDGPEALQRLCWGLLKQGVESQWDCQGQRREDAFGRWLRWVWKWQEGIRARTESRLPKQAEAQSVVHGGHVPLVGSGARGKRV